MIKHLILMSEAPALFLLSGIFVLVISRRVKKQWMKPAIMIFLLAMLFRLAIPQTMRLFFDEDIYLEMGYNIVHYGQSGLCDINTNGICSAMELMKWPALNPLLASIGVSTGINLRFWYIIISSLIPVFGYLIGRKFSEKAGWISGLLLAFHPLLGIWGTEFAAENILALGFLATAFMSLEGGIWETFIASAVFSQAKPEGIVLFTIPLIKIAIEKKLPGKRDAILMAVTSLLLLPFIAHLFVFFHDPWGSAGQKFSIQNVMPNLKQNLAFYFDYRIIDKYAWKSKQLLEPIVLAVIGLFGFRKLPELSIPAILLFSLYLLFYAGSVAYGVDARYQLPVVASLAVLAGIALPDMKSRKIIAVLIILNYVALIPYAFASPSKIQEAKQAREYRNFVLSVIPEIRKMNCSVISHVSSIYNYNGVPASQPWESLKSGKCTLFDRGFWCTVPGYEESCNKSGEVLWKYGKFEIIKIK